MSQDVENCLCLVLQETASASAIEKAEENFTGAQVRLPGRLTGLDDVPKITPLIDKESILGRSTSAAIMIMSQSISRVHARITRFDNGLYEITDESSGNGVYLNGVKLAHKTPHALTVHDEVSLCPPNCLCVTFLVEPFNDSHRGAGSGMKRELSQTSLADSDSTKRFRGMNSSAATVSDALDESELATLPSSEPFPEIADKDAPSTSGAEEKKEEVEKVPAVPVPDDLMCSICSELYIKATELNCGHMFCESCINEWRRKRQDCPMCRVPITSTKVPTVLSNVVSHFVSHMSKEDKKERAEIEEQREKAKAAAPPPQLPPCGSGRLARRIVQLQHFHHRQAAGGNVPPVLPQPPHDLSRVHILNYAAHARDRFQLAVPPQQQQQQQQQPQPQAQRMGQVISRGLPQGWRVQGEPFYNAIRPIRVRGLPHQEPVQEVGWGEATPRYVPQASGPPHHALSRQMLPTVVLQRPSLQIATSTSSAAPAGPFGGVTASTSGVVAGRVHLNPAPVVGPATTPLQPYSRRAIDLSRDAIEVSSDSDDSSSYSNDSNPLSSSFDRAFLLDDD